MRYRRQLCARLLGTALLVAPSTAVQETTANAATPAPTPITCNSGFGNKTPVLLVHGFSSEATDTWKTATAPNGPFDKSDPSVEEFFYGGVADTKADLEASTYWVTDPRIGHDLALTITCLAKKSADAGGTGKVLLVAHSLGGLAIRCAADPVCNDGKRGKIPGVSSDIAGVVTMGTPNDGSFLRVNHAIGSVESIVGSGLSVFCQAHRPIPQYVSSSSLCNTVLALGTSEDSKAFTPGSSELTQLPFLKGKGSPLPIPILATAGRVNVSVSLGTKWLNHKIAVADAGDLVVGTDSALDSRDNAKVDGLGGTAIADCGSLDLPSLTNVLGGAASIIASDPFSNVTCNHITEPQNGTLLTDARNFVNSWRAAHDPTSAALRRLTIGLKVSTPVAVPGGDEAAVWDDQGDIHFWKWTSNTLTWTQIGTSTYPIVPRQGGAETTTINGFLLPGMSDAVFIADGQYSGDGTGHNIAFTNGPHGWGTLAPQPDGTLVPTGNRSTDNSTPGLSYAETIDNNELEEAENSPTWGYGTNGSEWMIIRRWKWSSTRFVLDSSNIFTAQAVAGPQAVDSVPDLPLNTCPNVPPDGTYSAWSAYAQTTFGPISGTPGSQPLRVEISMQQNIPGEGPGVGQCTFSISPYLGVTIPATKPSGASWISAPAWILTRGGSSGSNDVWDDLSGAQFNGATNPWKISILASGGTPYFIPPSLGISGIPQASNGHVIVTIRGRALTQVTVLPDQ